MKIYIRTLCVFFLLAMVSVAHAQTPNPNIRLYGYLPVWALQMGYNINPSSNYENMLYTNIDRDACTDWVTFNTGFNTDGTTIMADDRGEMTAWNQPYFQKQKRRMLNDWIHAAGKRVHLCFFVSGNGGDWSTTLASSTYRNNMIRTIVDSVIGPTHRYDGVNFDVEPLGVGDTANLRIFLTQLRDTLDKYHQWVDETKKPEISVCFFDQWGQSKYWGKVAHLLNSIQHMSYNMMGDWETISWYNAPVYQTGYTDPSYNVGSIAGWLEYFVGEQGIPRDKMVMACPFNYNAWKGEGCYAPLLPYTTTYPTWSLYSEWSDDLQGGWSGTEMYFAAWNAYLDTATAATVHYDNIRKAAWAGVNNPGTANDYIIIFQDTTCVRENLQYVSSQGIQGAMIWEVSGAYCNNLPNVRHPTLAPDHLLQAAKKTRYNLMGVSLPTNPDISISPTSMSFGNVVINTTSTSSYSLSASNLIPADDTLSITAPTGYTVSKTSGSGYASSITCAYSNNTLSATTIYVRFSPTAVQSYSGNITNSGGGASARNVAVTGTGISTTLPAITVNPTTVPFGDVVINTTSSELTYTLSGSNLTPASGNITITASSGRFRISQTSGSGFGSPITVAYTGGTLPATTIYVRFTPRAVQNYNATITNAGGGATIQSVTVSGSGVSALPAILTVNPTTLTFGNISIDDTSNEQTYEVTGLNLTPATGSILITAPSTAYQVSLTSGSGFGPSVNLFYSGGTISSPITIFVRFLPTVEQSYSGSITNTGGGATTQDVSVSGSGVVPIITVSPTSLPFGGVVVNTSSERTYNLNGINLTPASGNIIVTASSSDFQISLTSGSGFDSSIMVPYSGGETSSPVTIYIKFMPTAEQNYSGDISNTGGGAVTQNVSVSGLGVSESAPLITVNPTSLSFDNVTINAVSPEKFYILSGVNLLPASGDETVTAPPGFQVSTTSGTGFSSSLTVAYSGGTLTATTIYVRFSPTAVQYYAGNIANTGDGAASESVFVSGDGVSPIVTVNPASLPFGSVILNTSSEQTYTLSGSYLQPANDIVRILAPTGFSISTTSGSGFNSTLDIPYTSSTLSPVTIYVRFSPTAVQSYSGAITNIGGGAATQNVSVSGEGAASLLHVSSSSFAFGNIPINTASADSMYILSGSNLTPPNGNIIVTAPSGFEVSVVSGTDFTSVINIPYSASNLSSTAIYVRFSPASVQNYDGAITNSGGGAASQDVLVSGIGVDAAALSISVPSLSFGHVSINEISREKSYELSGLNLIAGGSITIISSPGFQVSATSGAGFDSSISISYSNSTLSSRSIYVRFSPIDVMNYDGSISNEGGGAPALNVSVNGTGLPLNEIVQLGQNFPNPFNPFTRIPYSVYKKAWVKLTIFNILGQRMSTLIDEEQDVGYYQPEFDISRTDNGTELTSGVYFYRLEITGVSFTKKLILLK